METFDWSEYLEENKCISVPEELFSHVEASLSNGIKQGMLLEVCHKTNPDIYWIAEITMVCGPLLRIKFLGAKEDFWCDISSTKVHPLGWCGKYDEQVEPPDEINDTYGDRIIDIMKNALLNGVSVSIEALKNKGQSPIDRIKVGMKVEVQNVTDPYKYWIATVCENVGGRLQLRYDGAEAGEGAIWLFFSSARLSGFGFVTSKGSPWQFRYPGRVNRFSCKNRLSAQLRQCAEEAIKEPTPADLFQPNLSTLEAHSFVVGMKLEALDPCTRKSIRPASVAKVFNNLHFLVVLDDAADDYEDSGSAWLCDAQHPYIHPIGWAKEHKVPFTPPKLWKDGDFDWDEYLTMTSSVPAPDYCFSKKEPVEGMRVDMMLEAVNPQNDEEIHVARVSRVEEHLVCVELLPLNEKVWYSQRSDCLFPVGWCDSNGYELCFPAQRAQEVEEPKEDKKEEKKAPELTEEWCDRIYFNYKCYAGPSLSRNKLAGLPQGVGPGPLALVLREVLNRVISASYKPAKLLRDWQAQGPAAPGFTLDLLRAKLKSGTYHAYVEVATRRSQVEEFCRATCRRLQACPALLAPRQTTQPCVCATTDKANFHHVTIERRGRPKGSFKKKKKPPLPDKPRVPGATDAADAADAGESSDSSRSSPAPVPRPTTRGTRPNFEQQLDSGRRRSRERSDSSSRSSSSRPPRISDVSDGEEPELKRLREGDGPAGEGAWRGLPADPAQWSEEQVQVYLERSGGAAAAAAARLRSEKIDGMALVLLDLPTLTDLLHMRKEPALQLCKHIALLRWHYLLNMDNAEE